MRARVVLLVPLLLLAGCGGPKPEASAADSTPAPPAMPAPELVLSAPGGVEVWFTDARPGTDANGGTCIERVMQIRRGAERIAIPLLYTGAPPRLVNDSTLEAPIWLHCRPGNVYQVNLRTGRPERVR